MTANLPGKASITDVCQGRLIDLLKQQKSLHGFEVSKTLKLTYVPKIG